MVNSPLIRPYLLGWVALAGGTLDSHELLESSLAQIASVLKTLKRLPRFKPSGASGDTPMKGSRDGWSTSFPW